jgi:hypothetical protein
MYRHASVLLGEADRVVRRKWRRRRCAFTLVVEKVDDRSASSDGIVKPTERPTDVAPLAAASKDGAG